MRIAAMVGGLGLGGAERQCVELVKGLCKLGHHANLVVFTDHRGPLRSEVELSGIPLLLFRQRLQGDLSPIVPLARWLRRQRIEVVHTFLFTAGYLGRLAGLAAGVPVIVHGERNATTDVRLRQAVVDTVLQRLTTHFVANSAAGREALTTVTGTTPERCTVIANGIDLERFAIRRCTNHGPPVVISVGRIWPQKGYETALEVVARCARSHALSYRIAGDTGRRDRYLVEYRRRLLARSDREDLRDVVSWLGYREDVPELLAAADIFLSTSHFEGMQNALLEAMASGLPVIAPDISDNRTIIRHEVDGFLIPPEQGVKGYVSALQRLLEDELVRRRMGTAARQRIAADLSVARCCQRHEELYRRLLRQAGIKHSVDKGVDEGVDEGNGRH